MANIHSRARWTKSRWRRQKHGRDDGVNGNTLRNLPDQKRAHIVMCLTSPCIWCAGLRSYNFLLTSADQLKRGWYLVFVTALGCASCITRHSIDVWLKRPGHMSRSNSPSGFGHAGFPTCCFSSAGSMEPSADITTLDISNLLAAHH